MAIKNAIYQVDNGADFDEIHFKTNAKQVYMSNGATVEDVVLNLNTQLSGNITRAKNLLASLSSKVE